MMQLLKNKLQPPHHGFYKQHSNNVDMNIDMQQNTADCCTVRSYFAVIKAAKLGLNVMFFFFSAGDI